MKLREPIGNEAVLVTDGDLKYIRFDCFEKYAPGLIHCMSTRLGGVSNGECAELNLGFSRKDSEENVRINYNRICASIGVDIGSLVFSNQVHESSLRVVTWEDRGKGFSRESDIKRIDGLLTNTPGVTLVTFYADCVPLFFFDPEKRAAASVHSGWRSTYKNIARETVIRMSEEFGSRPGSMIVAIGPSIGSCCFEVGGEVYTQFAGRYPVSEFYIPLGGDKWKIDLKAIITEELKKAGLDSGNIYNCGICTRCRKDLFFSHRGDQGRTGSLAAFMQIA